MRMRKKWILFLSLFLFAASGAARADSLFPAADSCEEGACPVPTVNESNQPVYAIVSPVGYHAVEMIAQAPRPDTLNGKKIALVGGSFMAGITHDELKACILEAYPTAEVFLFQEVGNAGPYSVFGQSAETVSFQNRLKELGIDAVIAGNCGCGLCTVKETGSAIAAEYAGVPAVAVGAPGFIGQIHSTGVSRGVPVLRTAEYPGAFSSHSEEELRRHTRETVWPQVVSALTRPITRAESDLYAGDGRRPYNEAVFTGTFDEVQEFCQANNWSDGLPVVPPTDAAVREALRFTPYAADEVLGIYPLAYRECTVYTVAVNAVMAGVPKELMPVCIALTQALGDGEWRRPLASTHGWTPYAWLNGPLARQLGIDCGQGMISGQKNKALGRFLDLMMLNLGGYYVKENRMGTFGYLTPFVFSEDEETCLQAGWTPFQVSRGYRTHDNTVTLASALAWGNNVTPATDDPEQIMRLLAFDITEKQQNGLGNTNPQVNRTVLLTGPVAMDLAKKYGGKTELEEALISTARRPLFMRAYANYWANTGSAQSGRYTFEEYYDRMLRDPEEQAALTDTPAWLEGIAGSGQIETIATMRKGQTAFLLAGDSSRNKFMVLPGGGTVTMEIRLPENWDALVAPMGYEPLRRFALAEPPATPAESAAPISAGAAENPAASGGEEHSVGIPVPSGLTDGEYRLVPSMEQMTGEGRILRSESGSASAWAYGAASTATLPDREAFSDLMKGLFSGCSLTVRQGCVTGIILRPLSSGQRGGGNAMRLTADQLQNLRVTIGAVARQSKEEGKATADGATLTVSVRLARFSLALGGEPKADRENPQGFLTLSGGQVTMNPRAPQGASARVGVQNADGTWRTLTFTKTDARKIQITYHTREPEDSLRPQ